MQLVKGTVGVALREQAAPPTSAGCAIRAPEEGINQHIFADAAINISNWQYGAF
jgi:hypothetical protein